MGNLLRGRVSVLIAAALTVASLAAPAAAETDTVLYSFCAQSGCADGASPLAGLIMDSAGHLYGTTNGGGTHGQGTVFELTPAGRETVLYSFCSQRNCVDGSNPEAGLIMDKAGKLYGTTRYGGTHGQGTVFELTAAGRETVLYSFCPHSGCADGATPLAGLIRDAAGHLYGTTNGGGAHGQGTVFELTAAGRETVLYSFCPHSGCADGTSPLAGLIMDASGKLYGTAAYGGAGDDGGVVFELTPNAAKTKWTETVLYSFCSQGCVDGATPVAGLIMDSGRLYGTTSQAGAHKNGTVFELTPNAAKTKWKETVLYSFCVPLPAQCVDGSSPFAGLIMDASGKLYGTTRDGGAGEAGGGSGTVFELIPNAANTKWRETVLHSFCVGGGNACAADGASPVAGLIMDAAGHHLYGTTPSGAHDAGTVFELAR